MRTHTHIYLQVSLSSGDIAAPSRPCLHACTHACMTACGQRTEVTHLSIYTCIHSFIRETMYPYKAVCLHIYADACTFSGLAVHWLVSQSVSQSVYLSVCLCVYLPPGFNQSIYLFVYLPINLSMQPSFCPSIFCRSTFFSNPSACIDMSADIYVICMHSCTVSCVPGIFPLQGARIGVCEGLAGLCIWHGRHGDVVELHAGGYGSGPA